MTQEGGDPMELVAWIDESGSNTTIDPGTYIMAAAITELAQVDAVRESMVGLLLPGQAKLHWRDERDSRQLQITRAVASCGVEHLIVVTTPHDSSRRPERRRRLTLEVLLPELARLGVRRAIMESRGVADDKRDREMLDHLRQQHLIESGLHVDHIVGRQEPILWVPDAMCGIITSLRTGNASYYDLISRQITLMHVPAK